MLTVHACISAAKNKIIEEWLEKTQHAVMGTFGHSDIALVSSLPKFLDHLIEMLNLTNSATSDFDYKLLAT